MYVVCVLRVGRETSYNPLGSIQTISRCFLCVPSPSGYELKVADTLLREVLISVYKKSAIRDGPFLYISLDEPSL